MNDLELRARSTWKVWQLGVLKAAASFLGAALGVLFADELRPYIWILWALGIVFAIWSLQIWHHARKHGFFNDILHR